MRRIVYSLAWIAGLAAIVWAVAPVLGQQGGEIPPAEIVNDEGGPVSVTGEVSYTNTFFTAGVASPVIILEDQAGFVARNRGFLMSPQSQTIGQITSDFFTSPFTYSLALPFEPQGEYSDVDNDGETDQGLQIFAVAYWTNTWGDPFLEERDLGGGGWSSAYASTHINQDPASGYEYIGGKVLIYAPDDQQAFPSGWGPDGLLFTGDEPVVLVPQGYTVVDLDTDPFTFDRSRHPVIDLIEGEGAEADDFSALSYTEAFDAMIEKFRLEYAFTEYKEIDWDAMSAEFRPRFEAAEANADAQAYLLALQDFTWAIPDGHVGSSAFNGLYDLFLAETDGGLGMAIRELDDGRVIVNFLLEDGPAEQSGIELRAEILAINGSPIDEAVAAARPWSLPFSSKHVLRLQQLRYVLRFPVDTAVEITYQNPGATRSTTVTMTTVAERDSFRFSSFEVGVEGDELPLEYDILDNGYAYVKIYSFFDNSVLSIQLWERLMTLLNDNGIPGLIIDMRQNGGGSGFLADQMAAYFFDEELVVGNTGFYDEELGEFYFNPDLLQRFYPPAEELRYHGPIAVLVGPNCNSACEFFSYNMTLQDRAVIVGQYPTGGLGGSVEQFYMPDGQVVQMTIGRAVDADGNIHIEGFGVAPTVRVPVTEETLFSEGDPILEYAIAYLDEATTISVEEASELTLGEAVEGELTAETPRVQYTLPGLAADMTLDFLAESDFAAYLRIYVAENNALAFEAPFPIRGLDIPADVDLIIEMGSENDDAVGAFTLTVRENVPVEWTAEDAGSIQVGDTVTGELREGVRFRYTLEVAADATLDFQLGDESGELDTYLRIYAADDLETPLFENDDIVSGEVRNSELLGVEVTAGQVLIIEVAGFGDYAEGAYFLTVTEAGE